MGEAIGGGVEIECWREVVPVLFHEARRLTVHVQFRTLKFSMTRREFHIKLSSEEDHCFLYKTAITQEGYQRFVHYHNLDVPFDQFSDYMHHLVHAVKNGHDPGERFFINILAPATTALPQTIEFIVTQRQMGCVVQSRRLNLTFTLASDAELKEHLINCFDRLKREKDNYQRRNAELEVDLVGERAKVKELEERNRYLQRELEFSQTLLKSAETIQKHYEALLKQQPRCKDDLLSPQNGGHQMPSICEEKPVIMGLHRDPQQQQQHQHQQHQQQQQQQHLTLPMTNNSHHHTSEATSHLESVMNYLTGNATEIREPPTLGVPSIIVSHQQQQQQQQVQQSPQQQQQQSPVVQQQQQNQQSMNSQSLLSSDTKKLKGAAKRKASFHNLTNPNPANAVNSSLEQQQAVHNQQQQQQQQHVPVVQQVQSHHSQPPVQSGGLHEHLARLHEMHQHQPPPMASPTSSTSLINPITAMNLLDDRHDIYSTGSNDGSFLGGGLMRDYLSDGLGHTMGSGNSLSPPLGNGNELMDRLSELNDTEWTNMKMEYGTDFPIDLGDVGSVDNGYGGMHLNDGGLGTAGASASGSGDDHESPNDSRNLNFDGVLSYFKCLICDGSFTVGSSHMSQHVSADSQRCTICTEIPQFDSKDELIKHMIGHSTRVYACQYCGKENPRVHYLKIHVRSHTGEKPYTCHQCGRGFADASTWRRHERVHTGEKPYQCNICGRKIARRDNVKIHMRSHMRTRAQLSCRTCGKPFSQANHLALHERICIGPSSTIETKPLPSSSPFPGSTA